MENVISERMNTLVREKLDLEDKLNALRHEITRLTLLNQHLRRQAVCPEVCAECLALQDPLC